MARLRSETGCPWDRAQDTRSLLPYLIEESCEFIDAAQAKDYTHMCEELGDVLFQVVFHSQVASELGAFDAGDVVQGVCEKMLRRHPHVFGGEHVESAGEVRQVWEKVKAAEHKGEAPKSAMDKVSKSLPALAKAQELQRRAAKVGFDWNDDSASFSKVREEFMEFEKANQDPGRSRLESMEDEFGDILFSLVNVARHSGLNAGTALMRANSKFERRFRKMEELAGGTLEGKTEAAMLDLWAKAKGSV